MENPFKFGSLVDAPYFTDRVKELDYIVQFLKSENHLVLMSPRRFGKSSLVKKGCCPNPATIPMAQYASRAQQRRLCGKASEGTAQSIQTGKDEALSS